MLYYVENVPGAWLDQANIKSVVIDETLGKISLSHLAYNKTRSLQKANKSNPRKQSKWGKFWSFSLIVQVSE